ncbi:MAG: hypothetical protein R6V06_04760 [Kiritimatiellia bacterium]
MDDFKSCGIHDDKTIIPHKKNVTIAGTNREKDGITACFPDNLNISYRHYNILTTKASMHLRNLTFKVKNLRYVLHIYGGSARDINFTIDNCILVHEGNYNKAIRNWPYPRPLGVGLSSGMNFVVKNSFIFSQQINPITHGSNYSFSKPATVQYINVNVEKGPDVRRLVWLYAQGSSVINTVELTNVTGLGDVGIGEGVWTLGDLDRQKADHNEFRLIMRDIEPRAYRFSSKGCALRIESKSKGQTSSVRFDTESSAFPLIIGKPEEDNNYVFKDGGNSLSGFAMGTLSLQENAFKYRKDKFITPLGRRLGNCSKQKKHLGVFIDNKRYDVVFDKNYDRRDIFDPPEYDNASIITEIKEVIGKAADVYLYDPGQDYYPEFKGLCIRENTDSSEVQHGMGVIFSGYNCFRRAVNRDGRIDGICLDDGRSGDKCRIITSGKIWAAVTEERFSAKEHSPGIRKSGQTLGISVDNPGVFDVNAKPAVLEAARKNVLQIRH